MKNAFKFGFLGLVLSLAVAACNSENNADGTDTTMTDTSMMSTDSMAVDTAAIDTMKVDSAVKM